MKKTLFTFSTVFIVVATLFMACVKKTTTSSSSSATTTTTGGTTGVVGSLTIDGTAHSVTTGTNVIGSSYVLVSNTNTSNYPSISINFAGTSAPAAGSYTPSPNYPTTGNCSASITPSISITWTVVSCNMTVTSGSSKAVTFNNATFTDGANTHTVSANLPF
jgi:hypothetical protein